MCQLAISWGQGLRVCASSSMISASSWPDCVQYHENDVFCAGFDVNKVGDARVGLVGESWPYSQSTAAYIAVMNVQMLRRVCPNTASWLRIANMLESNASLVLNLRFLKQIYCVQASHPWESPRCSPN